MNFHLLTFQIQVNYYIQFSVEIHIFIKKRDAESMYVKKSMKEFEAHVSYLEVKIWLQEANRKSETEERIKL